MSFRIHPLPKAPYDKLFALTDDELAMQNAIRVTADANPGFPCRVSLADAEVGEELILINHQHLDDTSPYAAAHAIYVRKDAPQATLAKDEVPDVLTKRLLSVRAFDAQNMMVQADVVDGPALAACLNDFFQNATVDFIHIHNAKQGCFAAKATRS